MKLPEWAYLVVLVGFKLTLAWLLADEKRHGGIPFWQPNKRKLRRSPKYPALTDQECRKIESRR